MFGPYDNVPDCTVSIGPMGHRSCNCPNCRGVEERDERRVQREAEYEKQRRNYDRKYKPSW